MGLSPLGRCLQNAERSSAVMPCVFQGRSNEGGAPILPHARSPRLLIDQRNGQSQSLPNTFQNAHSIRQWDSVRGTDLALYGIRGHPFRFFCDLIHELMLGLVMSVAEPDRLLSENNAVSADPAADADF